MRVDGHIQVMMSPDGVDIAQTRWFDTCCFHLHFLLWWCPWSIPSGHQLITHAANYTLLLVWQEQRMMFSGEKFCFVLIAIV